MYIYLLSKHILFTKDITYQYNSRKWTFHVAH